MLEIRQGNIFDSETNALVNPVNTEGVMGKGLAYQFKKEFPQNYENYKIKCERNEFNIGSDLVYTYEKDKIIVNFPTKKQWREKSKLIYIKAGLTKLKELVVKENIQSIAIPPLGAGNGKLNWGEVKELLIDFEKNLDGRVKVIIYEPTQHEFRLGKPHLLLTKIILKSYAMGLEKKELTDMVLQKITYLSDPKNYFKFMKYTKGPFSKLINITYNELKNYSRVTSTRLKDIEMELDKKNISKNLQNDEKNIEHGILLYLNLKKYYGFSLDNTIEIEHKLELLATILYIMNEHKENLSFDHICDCLFNWNKRKADIFSEDDVNKILDFLVSQGLLIKDIFHEYKLNSFN